MRSSNSAAAQDGPSRLRRSVLAVARLPLLAAAVCVGCQRQSPVGSTDPAKAPWFDPKVQIEGLSDADMRLRAASAINLGNMGAKASEALPMLEKLAASDPEPKVREKAREAAEKVRAAMGGAAASR
ncbi:MAG: hypothetical protein DCC67_14375 [Planctomycetota bacterium]|nr:MAG: hypothetical protein DCC67_14375 [Planctomycetota bacterium]